MLFLFHGCLGLNFSIYFIIILNKFSGHVILVIEKSVV